MSQQEFREKVGLFEQALHYFPQTELPVTHHFADGIYGREMWMPKGTLAVGKIHRTRHLSVIAQGAIAVATPEGLTRIQAPAIWVSPPGAKRVAFALEDTVWITVHPTDTEDIDVIEQRLIAPSFDMINDDTLDVVVKELT